MDKKLIIFTNEKRLKEVLGDDKDLDIGDKKALDGVQIELFNDSLDEAKLVNDKKPVEPQATNENLYFILHKNAQENYESTFRKEFPGAKIEVQSHIEGQFYHTYLPKIQDGSFTQRHLEDFFQTELDKALDELCTTWSTIDFTDKDAMETLTNDRAEKLNPLV